MLFSFKPTADSKGQELQDLEKLAYPTEDDDFGNVFSTEFIGDIVQSIEVYGDKLIVLINNSHMIKVYNITSEGLSMPGIEVSTNDSSPREMVVLNDKVYFTNWNSRDIKVFNLITYQIEKYITKE